LEPVDTVSGSSCLYNLPNPDSNAAGVSKKNGYTLIELTIVLFILALVLAMALPSFSGFGEKRLKTDARKIASLLRYINDSAISTKETHLLKFDLDRGGISWKDSEGEKQEVVKTLAALETQSKGEVKEGQIILSFGAMGMQENISVHLRDAEEEMTVIFNAISGRAKIRAEP
jgi:type II secretion system protein H